MTHHRSDPTWQRYNHVKTNVPTIDPLAVIYNEGQWKLSKVSPLYMAQYDTVKLKQYASKIRQTIVGTVTANSSLKYTVKIEAEPYLKYSSDDPDGLVITVSSTNEGSNKTKVAYSAVLLSWGESTIIDEAVHLPYMLERGEQKIATAVKSTLQTIFDCNVKQFCFTQQQLLQFGYNFLEYDTSKDDDKFGLAYKTPQVDHKDKLRLSFNLEDMRIIWNGAKDEAESLSHAVGVAYQLTQEQIFHMVTLDVSVFTLIEVTLPKAEVKSNGIVKMKTPELVNSFFNVLNGICASNSFKLYSDTSSTSEN